MKKITVFKKGFMDVIPLTIPVIPFGVIYGVVGVELGLSPLVTFAMSFIIFAGSSQIAFVQLYTAGASPLVMISSVLAINSRHFLYSAVLAQYLNKLNLYWKILLSYLMTDQAFSVSLSYFKKNQKKTFSHYHMLGSGFTLWLLWQISTLSGIVLGNVIPEALGLEFAIPLTFLSLIIAELKKYDHLLIIIISGAISLITYNFPLKVYIILSAFVGLVAAFILTTKYKEISE